MKADITCNIRVQFEKRKRFLSVCIELSFPPQRNVVECAKLFFSPVIARFLFPCCEQHEDYGTYSVMLEAVQRPQLNTCWTPGPIRVDTLSSSCSERKKASCSWNRRKIRKIGKKTQNSADILSGMRATRNTSRFSKKTTIYIKCFCFFFRRNTSCRTGNFSEHNRFTSF